MPIIYAKPLASNHDILVYCNWLKHWECNLTHNHIAVGYTAPTRRANGSGIYFPNIQIPKGASITYAFVDFTSSHLRSNVPRSIITVEDNANPQVFSDLTDYQDRIQYEQVEPWGWDYNEPWEKDHVYRSPDIRIEVQHLVDLPLWTSGNAIVVLWNDHFKASRVAGGNTRIAYSYDKDPNKVPVLIIKYEDPPPPPPGVDDRFSTRDFSYRYHCDGYTITVLTDTPCHMFMRWSTNKSLIHDKPVYRRGLWMHGDRYFCFTAYNDNEQEEAGDTMVHTFIKRPWPVCETRWFYFWSTINGLPALSTSPVFKLHFDILTSTFHAHDSTRTLYQTNVDWPTAHDAANGIIMGNYGHPWYRIFAGDSLTASFWLYRAALTFDLATLPHGIQPAGAYISLWITEKFLGDIGYPYLYVTQGVQADPVVIANYGDQLPLPAICGQINLDDLIVGKYNVIPLNDLGLQQIFTRDITRFSLRGQKDIENRDSIAVYDNYCRFFSAQAPYQMQPLLTVCYPPY